jgi:hypothetical protein
VADFGARIRVAPIATRDMLRARPRSVDGWLRAIHRPSDIPLDRKRRAIFADAEIVRGAR